MGKKAQTTHSSTKHILIQPKPDRRKTEKAALRRTAKPAGKAKYAPVEPVAPEEVPDRYFFRPHPGGSKSLCLWVEQWVETTTPGRLQEMPVNAFEFKEDAYEAVAQLYQAGKFDDFSARRLRDQVYNSNLNDAKSATLKATRCSCPKNHLLLFVDDKLQADVDSLSKGAKEYMTITRSTKWRFLDSNIEEFRIAIMRSGLPEQTDLEIAMDRRISFLFLDEKDGSPVPIMMVFGHGLQLIYTAFSKAMAYEISCYLLCQDVLWPDRWQTTNEAIAGSGLPDEMTSHDLVTRFMSEFMEEPGGLLARINGSATQSS